MSTYDSVAVSLDTLLTDVCVKNLVATENESLKTKNITLLGEATTLKTEVSNLLSNGGSLDLTSTQVTSLVTSFIVQDSLQSLDFNITNIVRNENDNYVIGATKNHESVFVLVENAGSIKTDWVGLSDSSCEAKQKEFEDKIEENGIKLKKTKHVPHRDTKGGGLVAVGATIAREKNISLEEGILLVPETRGKQFKTDDVVSQKSKTTVKGKNKAVKGKLTV
ncbi:MAG: hypothetical protein LBN34_07260 [Clostridiales Family XIII bacterium]|nr:hypothetical protein [Clostridiales Family XIII bacterium]